MFFVYLGLSVTIARHDGLLRFELRITTFTFFLVTIFLIYPSCSVKVLSTFACRVMDDGSSFMTTDPQVDCYSDAYNSIYQYALFMTLVYPVGVPCFYALLLLRERNRVS